MIQIIPSKFKRQNMFSKSLSQPNKQKQISFVEHNLYEKRQEPHLKMNLLMALSQLHHNFME